MVVAGAVFADEREEGVGEEEVEEGGYEGWDEEDLMGGFVLALVDGCLTVACSGSRTFATSVKVPILLCRDLRECVARSSSTLRSAQVCNRWR